MKRWLLLGLLVGCTDLELSATSSNVIGGQPTLEGEFPGVGALMFDFGNGPEAGCTGTLIAPDAVLTAAHCVDPVLTGGSIPGFTFALDTTTGTPQITPGRMTIKHEMFTLDDPGEGLGEFFDVGLVLLAEPVLDVRPVPMPRMVDVPEILAGLDLEIAGYGKTTLQSDEIGVLFDARTKLISLNPSEIQVGMGSPQPQNCNGDSGGPGFAVVGGQRRVIGIVSRSFSGFECIMGGIDTRVDAYLPWIHEKVPLGIPCNSGLAEACPEEDDGGGDDSGCCSTGSRGLPGSSLFAIVVGFVLLRRRVPLEAGRGN